MAVDTAAVVRMVAVGRLLLAPVVVAAPHVPLPRHQHSMAEVEVMEAVVLRDGQ